MLKLNWASIVESDAAFLVSLDRKSRRDSFPEHTHDFAEMFWIVSGKGTHVLNGQAFPLKTGDVCFICPADYHQVNARSAGDLVFYNIAFPWSVLCDLDTRYFSDRPHGLVWSQPFESRCLSLEHDDFFELNKYGETMLSAERRRLVLDRFLLNVLSLFEGDDAPLPPETPDWLVSALQQFGYKEHLSRGSDGLVSLCGRCPEHVSRSIKKHLGVTMSAYVNQVRMDYAAKMLESTTTAIIEIAMDCGFENVSYFHSLFKAHTGMTPRHYRTQKQTQIL